MTRLLINLAMAGLCGLNIIAAMHGYAFNGFVAGFALYLAISERR